MTEIKEFFKNAFESIVKNRISIEEKYYQSSSSLEDLERRMDEVRQGRAPWQKN